MTSFDFSLAYTSSMMIWFSRRPKSWIFSSSPIFDKSQISLFSWVLVLDLHRLHGCREERCPCSSSNVVAKKNVWSGRRISRRAIHNYFLFLLINRSSKESKPSKAHPRIFFLSLLLLPMTCVNPFELFFTASFFLFSSSKSPCGNFDYLTGVFAWNDVVDLETQEKKFDCDNCSWRKTRKTKRTCRQVWIFITLTRWLSTMMRKDFRLNFSVFVFSTICLESGNVEFVFSEEIIRRPENGFDDALSLLQRLMADFRSSKRT